MERFDEEEIEEPVSPTGQYCNSSAVSLYILGVLEIEVPIIDESIAKPLLQNLFLPVNSRFSSIMVTDINGEKKWKKVEVNLDDHIKVPTFPKDKSSNFLYDEYFDEYMSTLALEHLPQNRPLWEIHIIKYPTSNAKGTLVFKLHHALGDGFSLMGALLSCMERADNTSLPFTLPSNRKPRSIPNTNPFVKRFLSIFSLAYRTISDFGWSLLKSSLIEDDQTPIRSGAEDTMLRQITISNVSFYLDHIKEIKSKLAVTVNDVLAGIVFFGIRLYMYKVDQKWSKTQSTALVVMNTRNIGGYSSVKEMLDTNSNGPWGNRFTFLHIPIPNLSDSKYVNPLEFIWEAHKETARMKNSLAIPLTAFFLDTIRKLRGSEATARYFHSTIKNSSLVISNMIGPVEKMAVANHPVKGIYFMGAGLPQSLVITMMSYMGKIRIAFGAEKDFIDNTLFKSCLENSFEMITEAAKRI